MGSDTRGALSLPTGSYVIVGFTDETIINQTGNDIFVSELGAAGDRAEIYISSNSSSNPEDFVFLGIGNGGITSVFDLASINFTQPVKAIKIVGLDTNGDIPGFDVVNVQGLAASIASPDFYRIQLQPGQTVTDINFGNQKNQPPTITSSPTFSIPENTTALGTVSATDAENHRLIYTISGQDANLLNINSTTGELSFKTPSDYETDSQYSLQVQVTDGINLVTQDITITITDKDESATLVTEWNQLLSTNSYDSAYALTIGDDGSVYVTGSTSIVVKKMLLLVNTSPMALIGGHNI